MPVNLNDMLYKYLYKSLGYTKAQHEAEILAEQMKGVERLELYANIAYLFLNFAKEDGQFKKTVFDKIDEYEKLLETLKDIDEKTKNYWKKVILEIKNFEIKKITKK